MSRFPLAAGLALLLAAGAALGQTLYRWTDEQGRVHVTDTPPPANAKEVKKERNVGGASSASPGGAEPYSLQLARKNYPVTLYTTPGCEGCNEARKMLNARGVPFKEVSVGDQKSIDDLKKAVGSNSVPAVVVGSTVQTGFEEGAYQRLLDAAGYPRTGVLPPRSQAEPAPAGAPQEKVTPAAEEPQAPLGPYAPGAARQRPQNK
jgi:glutaredoxin